MAEQSDSIQMDAPAVADSSLSTSGLVDVFTRPTAFFEKLKDGPKVLIPYLVYMLVAVGALLLVRDYSAQLQIDMMQSSGRVPVEQIPTLEELQRNVVIGGSIALALAPLFLAVIAMFWGNFILGGSTTFRKILSVVIYGEFLFAVGFLITALLMVMKGSLDVTLSLGVLALDKGLMSVTYQALSKISVFHIWEVVVLGIGFSKIYSFKSNKGYLLAVLSMAIVVLLHLGTVWMQQAILG